MPIIPNDDPENNTYYAIIYTSILEKKHCISKKVERQLSKAFADIQLWKTRYETEGVARCEEIDKVHFATVSVSSYPVILVFCF